MNYYNEFDPNAAAWLRQLISNGNIPAGDVDTRSITDVSPSDLAGYTQCHFFAGIGGWSYALQLAGWDSARPIWTGSCPCQPFSSAGKGLGAADERHLWPAFFNLIKECRPQYVFGEQVASAIGHGWLDGVSADLGKKGYACGSAVLGAHSIGAPHIRQRLYWMAYANDTRPQGRGCSELPECADERAIGTSSDIGWLGDTKSQRINGISGGCDGKTGETQAAWGQEIRESDGSFAAGSASSERMGNTNYAGCPSCNSVASGAEEKPEQLAYSSSWHNHTLIPCRDGKQRRIESGTFPLVNGLPRGMVYSSDPSAPINPQETAEARVMRLKGYGNAIVPQTAATFIQASIETIDSLVFT